MPKPLSVTLTDSHCHLDFNDFEHDRQQVLDRAKSVGVNNIIIPSTRQASWQKTIDICQQYTTCHLALGLHPVFIDEHQPQHLSELDSLITQQQPIAVGEIGLDFYLKTLDKKKQLAFFSKQLIIAQQHNLPLIIHNRKAHDEAIKLLSEIGSSGGIIHAFNGSIQQAGKYIELGFLLGFGGMLTYSRSNKLRRLAQQLPLEAMVLETDAPDMTVEQHKGERNSPEYLPLVQQSLAQIKQISCDTVAKTSNANIERVFNIKLQ